MSPLGTLNTLTCPTHDDLPLHGGPAIYHCAGGSAHGHRVQAADLELEVTQ